MEQEKPEAVDVIGIILAVTPKAVLLSIDGASGEWFPLRHCEVIEGELKKRKRLELRVPLWLWEKKTTERASRSQRKAVNPSTHQTAVIPPAMLKRLIHLCHPDKHNNSEASTLATEWLLAQRKPSKRKGA